MALPTIDATAAGSSANSYCTLAEANTYHESHLYSTDWDDAATKTKNVALVMAARLLDEHFDWTGSRANSPSVQAMRWPRIGMYSRDGYLIAATTVPQALKDAQSEYARQLIASNLVADSDVEAQGISELTAGSVSLVFRGSVSSKPVPDAVKSLLPPSWGEADVSTKGAIDMGRG